jgi:hypothetical protein
LRETSLHAAIKSWYAQPGDEVEVPISGYIADLVRGDLLIEIQTRNFSAIRSKLSRLLTENPVRLLHPIARNRWIVYQGKHGESLARRMSPKHGRALDLFNELVYIPDLLTHPNLTIEVLLVEEEEIRQESGRWSWRRKGWKMTDRRLLGILERVCYHSLDELIAVIPASLPDEFTNRELASALACPYHTAQKITYTLREAGGLVQNGKRGNSLLYKR